MNNSEIKLSSLSRSFQKGTLRNDVLKKISQTFVQGNTYAITGVSGIGKSTLLTLIAGLDEPTSGSVFFDGKDVHSLSSSAQEIFLNKKIGLVFQQPFLLKELSVIENLMIKDLIVHEDLSHVKKKVDHLLKSVGLDEKKSARVSELSGGQQQRLSLARALLNQPAFLLADELTGNLDVATGKKIVDLVLQLQKEYGMGVIITSHDPYVAKKMDTVFELQNGVLVPA